MELEKSWRSLDLRKLFTILYICGLLAYLVVGFMPAKAIEYEAATDIQIPIIDLASDVATIYLSDNKLDTPDTIVGRYAPMRNKTLLFGHSSTVFRRLDNIRVGDKVIYDGAEYIVRKIETLAKDDIDMGILLRAAERDTIVIMTCAGESLGGGDATHRLIVTATVSE